MTARWQTGTVACGGEEIYYEVSGDDDLPAIMLTHGAGGTHAAWFQQVPTLAANGFRVITWDCRGFGNSTFTSGVHGSAAAVADMAAVLDATGTPGAHLVGQSMGGWWVSVATGRSSGRMSQLGWAVVNCSFAAKLFCALAVADPGEYRPSLGLCLNKPQIAPLPPAAIPARGSFKRTRADKMPRRPPGYTGWTRSGIQSTLRLVAGDVPLTPVNEQTPRAAVVCGHRRDRTA